jgi:hypothetical protein
MTMKRIDPVTGIETEINETTLFQDLKALRGIDPIQTLIEILITYDLTPEEMDEIIERFKRY